MKPKHNYLLLVLVLVLSVTALGQNEISVEDVLRKTQAKLASLKTLGYKVKIEYNYASDGYLAEINSDNFIDFAPEESVIGVRYQLSNAETLDVYNGSERFVLKKKPKTINVQPKPAVDNLKNATLLQFSPLMLRNSLPKVLADTSISKKLKQSSLNGEDVYLVELTLDKTYIDSGNGELVPMTTDRKTIYRIAIDKQSHLPLQIYRGTDANKDFNQATYSDWISSPKAPSETSWYYSSYTAEYQPADNKRLIPIKAGATAHEISLPVFGTKTVTSLSSQKGKVVLLDFWIFHCGYCQESVPKLNAIYNKFRGEKNFKMLTVNVGDSEKLIQLFIKNLKPQFPILQNGEEAAKLYGVDGYPLAVLVGKDGTVIYSGPPDPLTLERLIADNLKN